MDKKGEKTLLVKIPSDLHKLLRKYCFENEITIKKAVIIALENTYKNKGK